VPETSDKTRAVPWSRAVPVRLSFTALCPLPSALCPLLSVYCSVFTVHCLLLRAYCPVLDAHCQRRLGWGQGTRRDEPGFARRASRWWYEHGYELGAARSSVAQPSPIQPIIAQPSIAHSGPFQPTPAHSGSTQPDRANRANPDAGLQSHKPSQPRMAVQVCQNVYKKRS
jgi:hypothetical protein